ncbi:MAG: NAD(P)H-binding protein [Melioribacteraceae bacterium]|nr:NAD(P)H-binding protein [Melioribacteraceae bacterium]MCF8262953.1 NAD(P)H-binding protein [Melioribacteraceae bacterium]MCF8414346.1 NAD(P)H-binding protein [Melioribacteraceae bacterium]MCF8430614.1 NAD(P)H-binding protein [Melioribacteraceae bacterium]
MKTALIIGATGLVGSELLKALLLDESYEKIKVFVRREVGYQESKIEQIVIDFRKVDEWREKLQGDVLFSTLGTTIKKAGSKIVQFKIDYTYQFDVAKNAAENGVKNYVLVSSSGADPNSKIFYTRMKGKLDRDVESLNFELIRILRPSILEGERKENRIGEKIAIPAIKILSDIVPPLKKHRPIHAKVVASAMINSIEFRKEQRYQIIALDEIFNIV